MRFLQSLHLSELVGSTTRSNVWEYRGELDVGPSWMVGVQAGGPGNLCAAMMNGHAPRKFVLGGLVISTTANKNGADDPAMPSPSPASSQARSDVGTAMPSHDRKTEQFPPMFPISKLNVWKCNRGVG